MVHSISAMNGDKHATVVTVGPTTSATLNPNSGDPAVR
jgi:hypothetical protein